MAEQRLEIIVSSVSESEVLELGCEYCLNIFWVYGKDHRKTKNTLPARLTLSITGPCDEASTVYCLAIVASTHIRNGSNRPSFPCLNRIHALFGAGYECFVPKVSDRKIYMIYAQKVVFTIRWGGQAAEALRIARVSEPVQRDRNNLV